ncbi:MAG TPA: YbjN domain-containing protein [Nitriliruptorales bacterium]|nr:YbjN domain-containing protein [Nitriliruptorales bacterium]
MSAAARQERDRVRTVLTDGLASAGLVAEQVDADTWATVLPGQRKRTLPVVLRLDDRSVHVVALLCGRPDGNHAEVFRYLLERNRRRQPVHFALGDDGDVVLVWGVPLVAVDPDSFDRLLGTLLSSADEVFDAVLRRGFAGYIDAEQRWRAKRGLPSNPVTTPPDA